MDVADLKPPEVYDGKFGDGLKNPCECSAPVLSGVFSVLLCALSDCRIIGYGRWDHRAENKVSK